MITVRTQKNRKKMAASTPSCGQEQWGKDQSGGSVRRLTIQAGSLTARIITYGAIVVLPSFLSLAGSPALTALCPRLLSLRPLTWEPLTLTQPTRCMPPCHLPTMPHTDLDGAARPGQGGQRGRRCAGVRKRHRGDRRLVLGARSVHKVFSQALPHARPAPAAPKRIATAPG